VIRNRFFVHLGVACLPSDLAEILNEAYPPLRSVHLLLHQVRWCANRNSAPVRVLHPIHHSNEQVHLSALRTAFCAMQSEEIRVWPPERAQALPLKPSARARHFALASFSSMQYDPPRTYILASHDLRQSRRLEFV